MPTGFGTATQSSERIAHVNERLAVSKMVAATRARTGAKWFYWIAALLIINSLIVFYGEKFDFGVWFGFTSVVNAFVKRAGAGSVLGIVMNALVAGVFITFGYFAAKAKRWAFLIGMALYLLDGLLLIERRHILSVGFHTYALYAISRGLAAAKQVQIQI